MNNRMGFTLGELLITVAIVGTLTGVSVPMFSIAIESSNEQEDQKKEGIVRALAADEYVTGGLKDSIKNKTTAMFFYDTATMELKTSCEGIKPYGLGTASGENAEDHTKSVLKAMISSDGDITVSWTTSGLTPVVNSDKSTVETELTGDSKVKNQSADSTIDSEMATYIKQTYQSEFNANNVVSWKLENAGGIACLWVTDVDITNVTPGTWVRTIRYNSNAKYMTYTACYKYVGIDATTKKNIIEPGTENKWYWETYGSTNDIKQTDTTKKDYSVTISDFYNIHPTTATDAEVKKFTHYK